MQPQSAQAHECDTSTMNAADYAACIRDHQVAGIDGTEDHNHAPMAKGSIDAVTLTAGMSTDAMDVSMYFEDTDEDDALTYTAMSNDTAVATAAIASGSGDSITPPGENPSILTIMGVGGRHGHHHGDRHRRRRRDCHAGDHGHGGGA